MTTKHLLTCLIFYAYLFPFGSSCFWFTRVQINIYNDINTPSTPLLVHCMSKDDDLGTHTLNYEQGFRIVFCLKPFSTLFHCQFQWGDKGKSFDAYKASWWYGKPCYDHYCDWVAKTDGIYLSYKKRFDWEAPNYRHLHELPKKLPAEEGLDGNLGTIGYEK
ncbi:Plant self-incompatibility protein S1 family [Striga hermonthica]|uniref:S-protein homolog n=1 Tax=Striga hermonthica TaxID=68872 RepID=A0A9N7RDH2_STRHE|nr:Plant self-incompatibility protein S1 family [Striga hermonthica]